MIPGPCEQAGSFLLLVVLCTWPCPRQADDSGFTFSHVYNIDLEGVPGCNWTAQPLPSQKHAGELQGTRGPLAMDGSDDVVFRHRIHLRAPKCDCEDSDSFKGLLYRINGLEEEVTYLKSQCSQGCCGKAGDVDYTCGGHGTYEQTACSCVCDPGWEGPNCSTSSCPEECNDNGRCVDGQCVCHEGYGGEDCSQMLCPNDCSDKGSCVDGQCVCFSPYTGEDCGVRRCLNDCTDNGRCEDGVCVCDEGSFGDDCSKVTGPGDLRLVRALEDSLLVEWDRVGGADHYVLTYHQEGSEVDVQRSNVPNTHGSYLIAGLIPGATYIMHVHAVIKGISSSAGSLRATTVLSSVDGIRVVDQTRDTIQVDWQNPEVELDHFRLTHASPEGEEEELTVPKSEEARTKHTIIGLFPGTEYLITVQAIKGTYKGKASSVTGTTDLDLPTNLVTREVTEDTVVVSWDRVQADVDGYVISYSSADGSSQEIPVGADSASYRLTGLRPGVVYTVYVWSVKGSRSSRRSSTQAETDLDAPANLVTREVTEDTAVVSWDRVQADVDGYVISYGSADGSSQEIPVGADGASYRLTGLRPGVVYTVYVWAVKGSRSSERSSTLAETDLNPPANLVTREVTEDTAVVSWDRVQADVDGYVISYGSADGSSQEIPVGADGASYRLTGLRPGVLYTVYVWAVKGSRSSRRSSTQAETEIDAPKDLIASGIQLESADVSWMAPQASIEGYILTYRQENDSSQISEEQLSAVDTRFALTRLEMGKRYLVTLKAYRGARTSRPIETTFVTVGLLYPFPMDCTQIMDNGNPSSSMYTIYVNRDRAKPMQVYCDMTTDGGGWIVFQRRTNGKLDFMRKWRQYSQGFGDMTDEFWLGLEKLYELTSGPTRYELRVDLRLGSETAHAVYDSFKVGPIRQKYRLTIGSYRGTAGDAMTYHQERPFSTVDSDNDISLSNCALTHRGAWWYKNCHLANLNGKYGDSRHSMGLNWKPWKGHLVSLDATEMKIRPASSANKALVRKRRSIRGRGKSRNVLAK